MNKRLLEQYDEDSAKGDTGSAFRWLVIGIDNRLSALETGKVNITDNGASESRAKQDAENLERVTKFIAGLPQYSPATPQPVRIRPEDMVMVKYKCNAESDSGVLRLDETMKLADSLEIEYISPIQPVRREWMKCLEEAGLIVWKWYETSGLVMKTRTRDIQCGDLWQPILSPDEPAPEGPETK